MLNTRILTRCLDFFRKRMKPVSLNRILFTVIIFALQIYIIVNRFKLLKELNLTSNIGNIGRSSNVSLELNKINKTILINIFLVTFSLVFSIFYLLLNPFKLNIYAHDDFKLGFDFDQTQSAKFSLLATIGANECSSMEPISPSSSSSASSSSTNDDSIKQSSTSSSKQGLTTLKNNKRFYKLSAFKYCLFKKPLFWPYLPPVGSILHFLSAFLLLIAELQVSSKRIQLGQKPIGDIFSTKLDFVFGQPIARLEQIHKFGQSMKYVANIASNTTTIPNVSDSNNKLRINSENTDDMPVAAISLIQSKDDFSLFLLKDDDPNISPSGLSTLSASYLRQTTAVFLMASNTINLDYLNFIIATFGISIKMSQMFWHTNQLFTFILITYYIIVSLLIIISYCSYEILFKAINLQIIARKLLSITQSKLLGEKLKLSEGKDSLNVINDYGHDLISTFLYLLSTLCLLLNGHLNVQYGFRKYLKAKLKFEANISKYLPLSSSSSSSTNTTIVSNECETNNPMVSKKNEKNDTISKAHMNKLDASVDSQRANTISPMSNRINASKFNSGNNLKCLNSFTERLLSVGFFLIYCAFRSLFLFDLFIVFKYSNDILFIVNLFFEILTIVVWIFILVLLNVKYDWSFVIDSNYKLIYWNWVYLNNKNQQKAKIKYKQLNEKRKNNSFSIHENKLKISTITSPQTSNNLIKVINDNNNKAEIQKSNSSILINSHLNNNSSNSLINQAGLLVRDDSLLLNRSTNMSSSSITEVSSLQPSLCANSNRLSVNILNVSGLNPKMYKPCGGNNLVGDSDSFIKNNKNLNSKNFKSINDNNHQDCLFNEEYDDSLNEFIQIPLRQRSSSCRGSITTASTSTLNGTSSYQQPTLQQFYLRHGSINANNKTKPIVSTIGEIMEQSFSCNDSKANTNQSIRVNKKNSNKNNMNDLQALSSCSSTSSSATVDSGRDSIIESPNSNSKSVSSSSNKNQQTKYVTPIPSNVLLASSGPNILQSKTMLSTSTNNQQKQPVQKLTESNSLSSHMLDTRC